jgi:hypothetical protein
LNTAAPIRRKRFVRRSFWRDCGRGARYTGGMKRPPDFTEEEIEEAMADCYVCLPITDNAALAAAVNKALESRYGPAE